MIVEDIRYQIGQDRQSGFEDAYRKSQTSLHSSPHCLAWELTRCSEDRSHYILRIEWDSAEGHLTGFRQSPEVREFLAAIRPYVGDIQEMRHYELTDVIGRK
jgi:quinol monooxygenase YgiN